MTGCKKNPVGLYCPLGLPLSSYCSVLLEFLASLFQCGTTRWLNKFLLISNLLLMV